MGYIMVSFSHRRNVQKGGGEGATVTHSGDHRRRAEGAAKQDVFLSNTKLFHAEIRLMHSSKLIPTMWSPSVVGERRGSGADSYRKSPDASHHSAAKAIFASLFSGGYTRPGPT